jgi:hypothetical protein
VLGTVLAATFGCGSGQYDANAPSAAPSEHGYAKTSSMQEDTAGATTEDSMTEDSATPSDETTESDSADDVDSVHAPAGGPSGPGAGAGGP